MLIMFYFGKTQLLDLLGGSGGLEHAPPMETWGQGLAEDY